MKTEIESNVGKHAFEVAGLGLAPFRFVGASENVITYPDGTQQAGGSCDYCGTGIRTEYHVRSADGKLFKVGCNCIAKVGDAGLMKAYKTSPEYRAKQRQLRAEKARAVYAELKTLVESSASVLSSMPHPYGFIDRQTGRALTLLDSIQWTISNAGAAGQASALRHVKAIISKQ